VSTALDMLSAGQVDLRLEMKTQANCIRSLDSKLDAVLGAMATQAKEAERQTRWVRVVHTELEALGKRLPRASPSRADA
jgi:hypothetical protein